MDIIVYIINHLKSRVQKQYNIQGKEKMNLFFGSFIFIGVFFVINDAHIDYIKYYVEKNYYKYKANVNEY